jgi:predicted nucleic acid-binding protein
MTALEFLDTNILVYAYDTGNTTKRNAAQQLLRVALTGQAIISTQVLAEFSATLLHKISPAVHPNDLIVLLDALGPIKVVCPDAGLVRRAVEAKKTYGIHFYDAMIVAAAEKAGCKRIWSEDLNPGQKYLGIVVENPFN